MNFPTWTFILEFFHISSNIFTRWRRSSLSRYALHVCKAADRRWPPLSDLGCPFRQGSWTELPYNCWVVCWSLLANSQQEVIAEIIVCWERWPNSLHPELLQVLFRPRPCLLGTAVRGTILWEGVVVVLYVDIGTYFQAVLKKEWCHDSDPTSASTERHYSGFRLCWRDKFYISSTKA